MTSKVLTFVRCTLIIGLVHAPILEAAHYREQWIQVYPELGFVNESVKITDQLINFDHTVHAYPSGRLLNDNIKSVCGAGTWIFYQHFGYRDTSEIVALRGGDCVDLKILAGDVSSLRYVGSRMDYDEPSFNIFSDVNFTGEHFTYFDSNNDTYKAHQSFIITGDSNWAVFEQKQFSGKSACLKPAIDDYVQVQGVPNHEPDFGIPANSTRSLSKGCSGREETELTVGTERLLLSDLSIAGISVGVIVGGLCIFLILLLICCRLRCCCWNRQYDV